MQAAYQTSVINGKKYITTISRGTEYCLSRLGDAWFVSSMRLGMGRHAGGGKHYKTFDDVRAGCKAFAALPVTTAL